MDESPGRESPRENFRENGKSIGTLPIVLSSVSQWNMQIKSTRLAIQTGQAYAYFFAKLVLHNGVPEDALRNQRDTVVLDASSTGTRSKGRLSSQSLNSFRCGGLVMTSGPILLALNPI